jgi:tetratricopeptide (TPR) repeat protein
MKYFFGLILALTSTFLAAQTDAASSNQNLSPAQRSIVEAQQRIAEKPDGYAGYNALATALIRRVGETSQAVYYAQAEDAVAKSLKLSPNNFDTRQIAVSILLGEHDFPAALEAAKELNKQVPDAVIVYGLLTDAYMALGNYKDAETSAQWMLNLRPGNLPALIRAAQLRELFGDAEGSGQLFDLALQSTPSTQTDDRAGLLTQMGRLHLMTGNLDAAQQLLQQALSEFPNYPDALEALANLRGRQKHYHEAVTLFQQLYQSAPNVRVLYELSEALQRDGNHDASKRSFAEFETKALAESNARDNANRELIFYYANYAHKPGKALALAKLEFAWRQDVYTLDAYAWALHVSGNDGEARKQMESALAVGIRDAQLFQHAAEIALKSGDRAAAERYRKESAELNATPSVQIVNASANFLLREH